MFSRSIVLGAKKVATYRNVVKPSFKLFATQTPVASQGHATPAASKSDVVIPELVDTLEWVLDSPPNVHQFDEPPIVVEIEHLKNLVVHEH